MDTDLETKETPTLLPKFELGLQQLKTRLENALHWFDGNTTETLDWKEDGFDLIGELQKRKGPMIEVAGPTRKGYELIDFSKIKRKVHVSNITPGLAVWDENTKVFQGYVGKVDFQADAQKLPFKDESVGGLFASCLPIDIRTKMFEEASRVLEEGGVFVYQGSTDSEIENAKNTNLKVKRISRSRRNTTLEPTYNVVFQKQIGVPAEQPNT